MTFSFEEIDANIRQISWKLVMIFVVSLIFTAVLIMLVMKKLWVILWMYCVKESKTFQVAMVI